MAVPGSLDFVWPTDPNFPATLAHADLPIASTVTSGGARGSSSQLNYQDLIYQQPDVHMSEPLSNELLESLQAAASLGSAGGRHGSTQFRESDVVSLEKAPTDYDPQIGTPLYQESHEKGQAIMQRTHNESPSTQNRISSLVSLRNSAGTGKLNEDTCEAVLDTLTTYCSSVVRRECEVAGIASAVADYIAWIRSIPPTGAPQVTNSVYQQMMENIEIRVRELVEVSQKRYPEPLRNLMGALEEAVPTGGAVAARVANLEDELQKQTRDHKNFFQTRYDACKLLSEQTQGRP